MGGEQVFVIYLSPLSVPRSWPLPNLSRARIEQLNRNRYEVWVAAVLPSQYNSLQLLAA
jgi:hypothetical protein